MIMHEARNLVRDLANKTMHETKRDETISRKVFFSHYCKLQEGIGLKKFTGQYSKERSAFFLKDLSH